MILKKKQPQINSGSRLALNQAILRGNPFMINALLEYGDASPFVRDASGKSPIHIAAAKLDRASFEKLLGVGDKKSLAPGDNRKTDDQKSSIPTPKADPMMPDADGNTFLHIMALGVIKDTEYDFIK